MAIEPWESIDPSADSLKASVDHTLPPGSPHRNNYEAVFASHRLCNLARHRPDADEYVSWRCLTKLITENFRRLTILGESVRDLSAWLPEHVPESPYDRKMREERENHSEFSKKLVSAISKNASDS